jgi:hypothetical protein
MVIWLYVVKIVYKICAKLWQTICETFSLSLFLNVIAFMTVIRKMFHKY